MLKKNLRVCKKHTDIDYWCNFWKFRVCRCTPSHRAGSAPGRNNNKWVCEMRVPNIKVNKNNKSRIWLETYPTLEMVARAHDVAALALKGKSVCLNFADSAWRLRLPESNDEAEIRRAAMEAARHGYKKA
jgi:hypothetical protein